MPKPVNEPLHIQWARSVGKALIVNEKTGQARIRYALTENDLIAFADWYHKTKQKTD